MHEHLDAFGIINMNGRVYDPLTAQFFSPDPYLQAPGNWLNYNRYAYCINNPLKYTDESGEWFGLDDLIVAGASYVYGYLSHGIRTGNWGGAAFADGANYALRGWLTYNTGGGYILQNFLISDVANQIMPSMNIPLGDHFGLSISPGFGFGPNGLTGGINMTGSYRNKDFMFSAGIGAGDNYWGWNLSAMDTRTGYGGGYGQTTYGSTEVFGQHLEPQRVGTWTGYFNHNSFSLSNDLFGDKHDRYRTNAAELRIGKWSVGTYLYTNDGEKASDGRVDDSDNCVPKGIGRHFFGNPKNRSTWTNGRPYYAPLWIGYQNGNQITRIGISRQWVHNWSQNFVHAFGMQNYYMMYDEFVRGTYFYTGYRNPLSLWDR